MTTLVEISKEVAQERTQIVERARNLKIINQETYDQAAYDLGLARLLEKKIEELHAPTVDATHIAHKAALAAKNRDLEPVLEVKRIFSRATADYDVEQERIRREAQRKLDEVAAKAAAEKRKLELENAKAMGATREEVKEMKAAPITFVSPTLDPTHKRAEWLGKPRENWSAQVLGDDGLMLLVKAIAAGKVQLHLVQVNQTALNQMARTFKDKMNVPGVKAVCENITPVKRG